MKVTEGATNNYMNKSARLHRFHLKDRWWLVGAREWGIDTKCLREISLSHCFVLPTFTNSVSGEVQKITSLFFFFFSGKELMVFSGNKVDGVVV